MARLASVGIAAGLVHATYFLVIKWLDIGVALTIQYLGPVLIPAVAAFVHGRRMRPGFGGRRLSGGRLSWSRPTTSPR